MEVFPGVAMDAEHCAGRAYVARTTIEVMAVLRAVAGGADLAVAAATLGLSEDQARAAIEYASHVVASVPMPVEEQRVPEPKAFVRAAAPKPAETEEELQQRNERARLHGANVRAKARDAIRRRRERTIVIADFHDSDARHVRVEWGPVPHLGITSDSRPEAPRTRRYWVDTLRVKIDGECVDEQRVHPDPWRVDLLVESMREWIEHGLEAEEVPEFVRNILDNAAVADAIDHEDGGF